MRLALRKHRRDVIAIAFVVVLGLAVGGYVLSNQRFEAPGWVPLIGTDYYTVKAELGTAQAVVPGQGQTVNVAGVKVGDIGSVELEDGRAVVELRILRKYAPIHRDATVLLRPKTGLKDMVVELDPGSGSAPDVPAGATLSVASAQPDVNPDEILAGLDGDTRAYLRVLLDAGGQAFRGRGGAEADLRSSLRRFAPTARDARAITGRLADRRRNLRRVVHNLQLLTTELGGRDRQLAGLVDAANANFDALARQERSLRASLRELPGTLDQTTTTLRSATTLSRQLRPALSELRPAARALAPALRAARPFVRSTTPVIRDQLRPFSRDVRPTVRELRPAARDLAAATPRLTRTFDVVNALLNTLAYDPPGGQQSYLFWGSWVNHAGATLFGTQDAHGPVRRGLIVISCSSLNVLDQVKGTTPQLRTLIELLNAPRTSAVCPRATP